jgi:antitoxin YefM
MQTATFTSARQNLASTMDYITSNHVPITITRQNKEPVVMISLEDFRSMEETAHLMQSINNASRLNTSIAELESGNGISRELIEDD